MGRLYEQSTRNFLTFVNTTAIAYGQKVDQSLRILVACNSSRVYKRQKITSTDMSAALGRKRKRRHGNSGLCRQRRVCMAPFLLSGGIPLLDVRSNNIFGMLRAC